MPHIDWVWFIAGILFGKFALDMIIMFVMNLFARVTGKAGASLGGA